MKIKLRFLPICFYLPGKKENLGQYLSNGKRYITESRSIYEHDDVIDCQGPIRQKKITGILQQVVIDVIKR